ncbi:MAG: glycosyltransferase family 39 protein [Chloroflexota bacterium]|nr:glycosyltransferase family 39 protein [Chloroflexota bacterium]MDQ5865321.1 glycosyltransferase family 39 protein [Chloroflexota bacterium]
MKVAQSSWGTSAVGVTPANTRELGLGVKSPAREALKVALLVWFVMRVVLSVWGATVLINGNAESLRNAHPAYPSAVWPNRDLYGMTVGLWNVYDAQNYSKIVEHGYEADPAWLTAYFPGLPLLIKLVNLITFGDSLLSGWLIANLSAIIFFWYLYRLVEPEYGAAVARRAVIFSAIFPASFFLFLGYVEATFLAATVAAFYYARASKWWLAGILGGLAALCKQPGIFMSLPFAYMYLREQATRQGIERPLSLLRRPLALLKTWQWLWLLLIPAAAGAYSLYRYLFVKAPLNGASDMGGQQILEFPGVPLLKALAQVTPDNPMLLFNLMDIFFTLLMIAMVTGVMLKVKSVELRLYSLALLVANLSLTMYTYYLRPEVNMPRRTLIIFPIFIFLGVIMEKPRAFRYVAALSLVGCIFLSGLWVLWVFVS